MRDRIRQSRWLYALAALAVGVAIGGFLPSTPLHAVATDSNANAAIATCPLDGSVEAILVLDFLTGDLKGAVISRRNPGFQAAYHRAILNDFGLDQGKKPQYLMVTGAGDIAQKGGTNNIRPSMGMVYVAEITSGTICAYNIPWASTLHTADQKGAVGKFVPWGSWKFRTPAVREPE
jgi:hypothetical protein